MKKNIATVHNTVIHASYTLTLPEKRLLMTAISKIHPDDIISKEAEFEYSQVGVEEYALCWGMTKSEARREIKLALETLFDRYITVNEGKTKFRWVGKLTMEDDVALLYWWKDVIPLISELSKDYTQVRLRYICDLTSFYHIRLYEWALSGYKKYRRREIHRMSLDDFRLLLDLDEGSYKEFNRLKERLIVPAVNAINAKTDLAVEWDTRKAGRKVVGLDFMIGKGMNAK